MSLSAPDDHLAAGPHCRVTTRAGAPLVLGPSNCRCWDCSARRCRERGRRSSPPQTIISVPVHTAVWQNRAAGAPVVRWLSNYRCWDCSGRQCSIGSVSASTPDDHFGARPDRRVTPSASGRDGAGGRPTIGAGIVRPPVFKPLVPPPFRPRRSFRFRSTLRCAAVGR